MSAIKNGQLWQQDFEVKWFDCQKVFPRRTCWPLIDRYNQDPLWHGILVQLPLPAHIDDEAVLLAIDPAKDVDGFHPLNMGHLWAGNRSWSPLHQQGLWKCFGNMISMLKGKMQSSLAVQTSLETDGPASPSKNATVTLDPFADSSFAKIARKADILVVAIGRAKFVTADFVKEERSLSMSE